MYEERYNDEHEILLYIHDAVICIILWVRDHQRISHSLVVK